MSVRRWAGFGVLAAAALAALMGLQRLSSREKESMASLRAARDLISSMGERKKDFVFPLSDERKTGWGYVPGQRPGISLKDMSPAQRDKAQALLRESFSDSGLRQVGQIRDLELVLREMENQNMSRDPELYWFMFFGEPSEKGHWSWRYEGHHCSVTFSFHDGLITSSTPLFMGTNPAKVMSGPKQGTEVLRDQEALGRALVQGLTPEQRTAAILSANAPADITTANSRKAGILEDKGIHWGDLSKDQQRQLRTLVETYAAVLKPGARELRLARVEKGGWSKIVFAWMGGTEPGQGHYYRIQGPLFLIEFDNTQNSANHIHSVWRDFDGDFGEDVLSDHYHESHVH